jgi:Protein of unknown function (DUF2510)
MTQPSPLPGWYPDPSGVLGLRYWDGQKWGPKAPEQQQPQVVINNTNTVATPAPVYVATGPNHALHLILTLLTCGMWLPVWIIVSIVNAASRPRPTSQPSGDARLTIVVTIGALILTGICSSHPIMLIPFAVLTVGGFFGYRYWRREEDRRAEQGRIAARADAEHRASLQGNPAGTYGQYPPPPLPEPDHWPPPNLR